MHIGSKVSVCSITKNGGTDNGTNNSEKCLETSYYRWGVPIGVIHDPAHTNNYSPQYVYDQEGNTGKYEAVDPK